MKLEDIIIEKIIYFIYTKQMSLKHIKNLPKHLQHKIFYELEKHDYICHQNDYYSCLAEILFNKCHDCDIELYHLYNYTIITLYFDDTIRCISDKEPLFIPMYQLYHAETNKT